MGVQRHGIHVNFYTDLPISGFRYDRKRTINAGSDFFVLRTRLRYHLKRKFTSKKI